ncbi:MAG: bacillithiol biosynthesis BshC, partial [Chitinophagaceae bacterium]
MDCISTLIPYQQTGQFSRIITDYLAKAPELQSFISYPVSYDGMFAAIQQRKRFPVNRVLLTEFLTDQYRNLPASAEVNHNIDLLKNENTFT